MFYLIHICLNQAIVNLEGAIQTSDFVNGIGKEGSGGMRWLG